MPHATILQGSQVVALLEDYATLEWTRPYWSAGRFTLEINRHTLNAAGIARGRLLLPPDESNLAYLVEQIETVLAAEGRASEVLRVSGRDYGGLFAERVVMPPGGLTHDVQSAVAAETALKHYVDLHAGPGAPVALQLPGLSLAADAGRGAAITYRARFQDLATVLKEIGQVAAMGWQITYTPATTSYVFDVIPGVDRSASVFFDVAFDTALAQRWLTSDLDRKTVAIVAGQGEGTARTIVTRWLGGSEPTGLERREVFLDARDTADLATLQQRGDAKLRELQATDRFETEINPSGSFRYRQHWDLGDLVTLRNVAWGIQQTARIVGVTSVSRGGSGVPQVSVELDRPWPSLRERLRGGAELVGASRV